MAEELESRDVLKLEGLGDAEGCRELLEGLTAWGVGEDGDDDASEGEAAGDAGGGASGVVRVADGVSVAVSRVVVDDLAPVSVLTWNVDGAGKSRSAPASFSVVDKVAAMQFDKSLPSTNMLKSGIINIWLPLGHRLSRKMFW